MTPGAFTRDLGYGFGKLRELHRFARATVVTEQEWIRRIAHVQARMLPQIGIRAFAPRERDEALAWASQPVTSSEPEPVPTAPSVHLIETSRPDMVGFEVNGRIHRDDMRCLITTFEQALGTHERLRMLVRVVNFDGVSLEAPLNPVPFGARVGCLSASRWGCSPSRGR
nr:STAS/SEC14 domain-containing protein [Microvirga sp. KLBC 81]